MGPDPPPPSNTKEVYAARHPRIHPHSPHSLISQHCHEIIHAFCQMMNDRQFSPSHPFWTTNLSPDFTIATSDSTEHAVGIEEYLGNFKHWMTDVFPDFRFDVGNLETQVDTGRKRASTLMNYMQVNVPTGISKPDAADIQWRWVDGRLVMLSIRTVAGVPTPG